MKILFYGEKHSFIEWTYAVGAQFQCVPTTYVTEIKEIYFEIYTKQVSCQLAFLFYTSQTANQYLNTCHYMANFLYLHDSYITKFDFMNYAFAKLVVAWGYLI